MIGGHRITSVRPMVAELMGFKLSALGAQARLQREERASRVANGGLLWLPLTTIMEIRWWRDLQV